MQKNDTHYVGYKMKLSHKDVIDGVTYTGHENNQLENFVVFNVNHLFYQIVSDGWQVFNLSYSLTPSLMRYNRQAMRGQHMLMYGMKESIFSKISRLFGGKRLKSNTVTKNVMLTPDIKARFQLMQWDGYQRLTATVYKTNNQESRIKTHKYRIEFETIFKDNGVDYFCTVGFNSTDASEHQTASKLLNQWYDVSIVNDNNIGDLRAITNERDIFLVDMERYNQGIPEFNDIVGNLMRRVYLCDMMVEKVTDVYS